MNHWKLLFTRLKSIFMWRVFPKSSFSKIVHSYVYCRCCSLESNLTNKQRKKQKCFCLCIFSYWPTCWTGWMKCVENLSLCTQLVKRTRWQVSNRYVTNNLCMLMTSSCYHGGFWRQKQQTNFKVRLWVAATCYLTETCTVLCCGWLVLLTNSWLACSYCQHRVSQSPHPTVWSRVHSSQRKTNLSF